MAASNSSIQRLSWPIGAAATIEWFIVVAEKLWPIAAPWGALTAASIAEHSTAAIIGNDLRTALKVLSQDVR